MGEDWTCAIALLSRFPSLAKYVPKNLKAGIAALLSDWLDPNRWPYLETWKVYRFRLDYSWEFRFPYSASYGELRLRISTPAFPFREFGWKDFGRSTLFPKRDIDMMPRSQVEKLSSKPCKTRTLPSKTTNNFAKPACRSRGHRRKN